MQQLQILALTLADWTRDEQTAARAMIAEITANFPKVVPKLHMLWHFLDIAGTHGCVGRYSESQIESIHSVVGQLMNYRHLNSCREVGEQMRRSLADVYIVLVCIPNHRH